MKPSPIHLLTPREAAEYLRLTESMLAHWRQQGLGPEYVRIGHRTVRYSLASLQAFVLERSVCESED